MGHVRRLFPIPNVETQQLHSLFIERISHLTIFYEPPTQSPWYAFSMYVHLLLLDNLISTLFEHLKILWFISSIYYLLLFVHLCPLYGMNNKLSSKLGMLADAAKHFLLCVNQQSIVLYFCSRLLSFIIFIHDL